MSTRFITSLGVERMTAPHHLSQSVVMPYSVAMVDERLATATSSEEERILWEGHSSQIQNVALFMRSLLWLLLIGGLGWFALVSPVVVERIGEHLTAAQALLTGFAFLPLARAAWGWLEVRCLTYDVTSERLRVRSGVFSRVTEELELYRVKDLTLHEPFFYRLFGLSSIHLHTSDRSNPVIVIAAIPNGTNLREKLRTSVERQRQRRGVRELDI